MNGYSTCKRSLARHALAIGLASLGATLASQASAGCGQYSQLDIAPTGFQEVPREGSAGFMSAVYRPGNEALVRFVDDRDDRDSRNAGIVGTWRYTYVSDGTAYPRPIPYGAMVDFGTAQWHSDGTEFSISGGRPPSSGDVCMGSWEQTGRNTYKLKHIALAWVSGDSTPPALPAAYLGPAIIRQAVTLNHSRNAFEGTFTIDQYAKDEITLLEHVSGMVTATRFSAD